MNTDTVTPEVINSIVVAVQAVTVGLFALLGKWIAKTNRTTESLRKDTKATREQVQNTHTTNLRDDMDAKHEELKDSIRNLEIRFSKRIESVEERQNLNVDRFNSVERYLHRILDRMENK